MENLTDKKKEKKVKESKYRGWAFTINNYTEDDVVNVKSLDADYFIYGYEVCPTTKTPHIQGYCNYRSSAMLLSQMKKRLPRAHLECAVGSPDDNIQYCMGYKKGVLKADKENEYYEVGIRPHQGKRLDLIKVQQDLEKKTLSDVATEHFNTYIRYGKMMREYKVLKQNHRSEPPIVEWVYGSTGVGKTKYAYSKSESVYFKDHTMWWDGYDQQEVIIIDDFDGKWPYRDLLRLLDRYPYQGQIKGGYVKINSKYIIITCDRCVDKLYEAILTKHELSQLKRRIKNYIKMEIEDNVDDKSCLYELED